MTSIGEESMSGRTADHWATMRSTLSSTGSTVTTDVRAGGRSRRLMSTAYVKLC